MLIVGIDEAGYGPRIGPLTVGLSVFRAPTADTSDNDPPLPDLWLRLRRVVGRAGASSTARTIVTVDDSKRLKGAASSRSPMGRIEQSVLAFLALLGQTPTNDAAVLGALGTDVELAPWYMGEPLPAPVSTTPEHIGVMAAGVRSGLARAGVELVLLGCRLVGEAAFNERVAETGSKAVVNFTTAGQHLREVWRRFGAEGPTVVVDRQGGRRCYGSGLARAIPGSTVRALDERHERSVYLIEEKRDAVPTGARRRRMRVIFEIEADSRHLSTALASMTAKYVRELAMARLNRYWCGRSPGLAPTAGYGLDAKRWLREVEPLLSVRDRDHLIRRA